MRISVLCPSRGRPNEFYNMCESLVNKAKNPDLVEIIVRLDNNDPLLSQYLNTVLDKAPYLASKYIIGDRLNGYRSFNQMLDECASLSNGELLFEMNDDCEMLTIYWDQRYWELYQSRQDKIAVISSNVTSPREGPDCFRFSFFLVSRRLYEIAGKSLSPHGELMGTDRVWGYAAEYLDCDLKSNVHIYTDHFGFSRRPNKTPDLNAEEGTLKFTNYDLHPNNAWYFEQWQKWGKYITDKVKSCS